MIKIDDRSISMWSKIGSRATFGLACLEIVKQNENFFVVTSDVSTSAGLDRYRKKYPDNYLDVGIAEQNMIGVAAGLSSEGLDVVTTTFSTFQTMRCFEQIRVNLGYMKQKVTMVGLASGLVLGNLGFTHCNIEDISIMRSIPNMQVLSPADGLEIVKCLESSLLSNKPTYIRLTGGADLPIINKKDYQFEIGKGILLKEGDDITIFSTGVCAKTSLDVAKILDAKNLNTSVINIHTIKPIDKDLIKTFSKKSKLIISIEEHNIIGGLGSSIAEVLSNQTNSPKHLFFGVNDKFGACGDYNFMKERHGLSPNYIYERIIREID